MQNLVYGWVDFSKFSQSWAKIGSNFRKLWKNWVILHKIWPKVEQIGVWMGHFFMKNWYLYGSTFKFCGSTSLPRPNLSTPHPCTTVADLIHVCHTVGVWFSNGSTCWAASFEFIPLSVQHWFNLRNVM